MKAFVSGGAGFIASHLVDYLIEKGHEVVVIDNLAWGKRENVNPEAEFWLGDIRHSKGLYGEDEENEKTLVELMSDVDVVFHLAAVSRTPHAIENPILTYETNVLGSANILEAARQAGVKKVVLASSNIVYAANTVYRTTKLAMEAAARVYDEMYGLPTVCLRFSNVYGAVGDTPLRQHPDNFLASFAKSKRENGYIVIHGDGTQTRNLTHVSDICEALYLAAGFTHSTNSDASCKFCKGYTLSGLCLNKSCEGSKDWEISTHVRGTETDIMNPKVWTLNEIAKFFDCPVKYDDERVGDIKHLKMEIGPERAKELLGFEAKRELANYISPYLNA